MQGSVLNTAVVDIEMIRHFVTTANCTLSAESSGDSEKSKCRSVIGKNLRPHDLQKTIKQLERVNKQLTGSI
jgi:hypothetical protein